MLGSRINLILDTRRTNLYIVYMKRILVEKIHVMTDQENLQENIRLREMGATLRKKDTGLPVNIWIDDMAWKNTGHWKKIKFQPDTENRADTDTFIPMSIEDNPRVLMDNPQITIDAKKLEQVKQFVRINKNLLLLYADQKITISEFLQQMKKE